MTVSFSVLSSPQSNKVPVVQHPHHVHPLTPLITYSNEHFTPGNPPPHLPADVDPKTGGLRAWGQREGLLGRRGTDGGQGGGAPLSPFWGGSGGLSPRPLEKRSAEELSEHPAGLSREPGPDLEAPHGLLLSSLGMLESSQRGAPKPQFPWWPRHYGHLLMTLLVQPPETTSLGSALSLLTYLGSSSPAMTCIFIIEPISQMGRPKSKMVSSLHLQTTNRVLGQRCHSIPAFTLVPFFPSHVPFP